MSRYESKWTVMDRTKTVKKCVGVYGDAQHDREVGDAEKRGVNHEKFSLKRS